MIRVIFLLLLVFCITNRETVWAQEDSSPRPATLIITLEPRQDRAYAVLSVVDKTPFKPNTDAAQKEVDTAFAKAFGGAVGTVKYVAYPAGADEDYYEEETPAPKSSKIKPGRYAWIANANNLGGDKEGPIRRTMGLQQGRFDPKPIIDLLRTSSTDDLKVTIIFRGQGAPYTECTGAVAPHTEAFDPASSRMQDATYFEKTVSLKDSPSTPPITFAVGYRAIDIVKKIVPAVVLMLTAMGATLIYRQRALAAIHKVESDLSDPQKVRLAREAIHFGYFRLITVGSPVLSGAWAVVYFLSHPLEPILWFLSWHNIEALVGVGMLSYSFPLFATITACILLSLPVMRQTHKDRDTASEPDVSVGVLLLRMGGQFVLTLTPLLFFVLGITLLISSPGIKLLPFLLRSGHATPEMIGGQISRLIGLRWLGWFLIAFGIRPFLQQIMVVAAGTPPLLLNEGPLVQRVRELAQKAGVNLQQIIFMPTGPDRSANAFAIVGNVVAFTDRLLAELSRREVDGIIAHELAHLKRKHPQALQRAQWWLGYGPIIALVVLNMMHKIPAAWSSYIWAAVIPLSTLIATLVTRAMSRRFEWEADTQAVALTGDPEGLILGLDRLRRLSGLPEDWGRADNSLLTHPSTARRIAYLSEAGQLSPEAKAALEARSDTMDSAAEKDRYRVSTDAVGSQQFVFSTLLRQQHSLIANILTLLIFVCIPLATAWLGERFAVPSIPHPQDLDPAFLIEWDRYAPKAVPHWPLLLIFYAVGVAVAFGCYITMANLFSTLPYRKKEPTLRRRLIVDGKLTEEELANALYVGLAPGRLPRLYAGGLAWDMGYLVFENGGRLRFVGERTAFALYPDQVKELRVSPYRWPSLIPLPRVELTWRGPVNNTESTSEGRASVLLAIGGARSMLTLLKNIFELLGRLQDWRQAPSPEIRTTLEPIPTFETAEGTAPKQLANPVVWVVAYLPMAAFAIGVALLANLPGRSAIYCGAVVIIMVFFEWIRMVRYREA